jgi:hypothetical protein
MLGELVSHATILMEALPSRIIRGASVDAQTNENAPATSLATLPAASAFSSNSWVAHSTTLAFAFVL